MLMIGNQDCSGGGLRRRVLGSRVWLIFISIFVVGLVVVVPFGVSAIQNIFIDGSQIIDIQVGGVKIDKVVFRGEVIWERAPQLNFIQEVTTATCPTTRTRVVDARDNATYWIQKLADNKCWMLTNLAYAGGGTNTYNDVKTITNSNAQSHIVPYYMIPTGSNRTVEPQDPSTSTSGTGQYGYLYNWCAAMGVQTGTAACMNATTPAPDQNMSICPSGWRLPTGGSGGEFRALTTAIGATNNTAGSTALRSSWLGMYSGYWSGGFDSQGSGGYYWSSTQNPSSSADAYYLFFMSSYVDPATYAYTKQAGMAVRCLAF